ncbi:solute carrier family 66 member 3 isoform X1 [Callorhinus ursinus]|uniref:PQ-loop repeat-containing protein 3 isoform X1 n=1 Tax=Callorhinus ursinus TaxID=34884 RepID=A0A3Q7NZC4_CALUR|nr:PQ-loop repeat-containing protein 3 isoform X1 [Callorhinus ursinus]
MREQLLLFCNWSTLGVCAALKLPQISAVLAARSARGISLPSLLLELAGFLVFLRYQCYYEYPLLTYLEYPVLIAQDALLLLCVFHFNGNVKGAAPYLAVFVASWFVLPLQKWIIDLAMNLSTFISTASKFAQLQYLWKTRDSGAVSALTWSLASYTCATRIITTLMTTSDLTSTSISTFCGFVEPYGTSPLMNIALTITDFVCTPESQNLLLLSKILSSIFNEKNI